MLFTAMPVGHNQIVQPVRGRVERRTLREELTACGVQVISSEKVRAYQRQMVKEERAKAGAWGKFWMFAYLFEISPVLQAMFVISCVISWMLILFAWLISLAVWGGVVAMCAVQTPFLYFVCVHWEKSIWASAHWRRVPVVVSGVYVPVGYFEMFLPAPAQQICFRARQIPGVRVFVEQLKYDPFMIAHRSRGFWRRGEECVIAYWNAPGFDPD